MAMPYCGIAPIRQGGVGHHIVPPAPCALQGEERSRRGELLHHGLLKLSRSFPAELKMARSPRNQEGNSWRLPDSGFETKRLDRAFG
jgi:hypothetical protein